jgi:hypothetical protein
MVVASRATEPPSPAIHVVVAGAYGDAGAIGLSALLPLPFSEAAGVDEQNYVDGHADVNVKHFVRQGFW